MTTTIFEPSAKDMKLDYPELVKYKEFAELKNRELKFCWYVGNRTSPITSYPKSKRIKKAVELSYGSRLNAIAKRLLDGEIPENILTAIERMASFNPSTRLQAKFNVEYIFDKMQKLILISDDEMKAMDGDEKKKYADLIIKVSSEMSSMVELLERGFGVKTRETKKATTVEISVGEVMDELKL